MQHVLITCSSASSSGTSSYPAASSAERASITSACETLQPRNLTANVVTVRGPYTACGRREASPHGDALTARDRVTFVLHVRPRLPRCPHASVSGEERGL